MCSLRIETCCNPFEKKIDLNAALLFSYSSVVSTMMRVEPKVSINLKWTMKKGFTMSSP
jgi:hypothetical protein